MDKNNKIEFDINRCKECPYSVVFKKMLTLQSFSEKKVMNSTFQKFNNNVEKEFLKKIISTYKENKTNIINIQTIEHLGFRECYNLTGCTFGIEKKLNAIQKELQNKQEQINSLQKNNFSLQNEINSLKDNKSVIIKKDEIEMNQKFIEHLFKENEELEINIKKLNKKLEKLSNLNNQVIEKTNVPEPINIKTKQYSLRKIFLDILIEIYFDIKQDKLKNKTEKEIKEHYFNNFLSIDLSFRLFKELQSLLFGKDTVNSLNQVIFKLNNEELDNDNKEEIISDIKTKIIKMLVIRGDNEKFHLALKQKIKPLCTSMQILEIDSLLNTLFKKYNYLKD
tara:strand:- start:28182 stop:29192 length:1011 start_codon:yes stop_codon:yes gene_type:complete